MPIVEALEAARNRDFAATLYTEYYGDPLPLVGATVIMEVRQYGGAGGGALASDTSVTFTDSLLGTAVDPEDGVTKPLRQLLLEPVIAKADLAALPGQNAPEAGEPQRFEYEILIEYADAKRDALWAGDFIVKPGVVA